MIRQRQMFGGGEGSQMEIDDEGSEKEITEYTVEGLSVKRTTKTPE